MRFYAYVEGSPISLLDTEGLSGAMVTPKPLFGTGIRTGVRPNPRALDPVLPVPYDDLLRDPNLIFVCPYVDAFYIENINSPTWKSLSHKIISFDPRTSSISEIKKQGNAKCDDCKK